MTTKCTMTFRMRTASSTPNAVQFRVGSFSESYYHPSDTFAVYFAAFDDLCLRRAQMLPTGAVIITQRFQQVNPLGPTQSRPAAIPGASGTATDIPQMALLVSSPGVGVRNIGRVTLRCIPDARVVEGEYSPSVTFTTAFNRFARALGNFRFLGRDLAQTAYPIYQIDNLGNYTLEIDSTLAVGQFVRVLRSSTPQGERAGGRFPIISVASPRTGMLQNWNQGPVKGGRMRRDGFAFCQYNYDLTEIDRVVTRKVGRPSKGYVGKVSKRRP